MGGYRCCETGQPPAVPDVSPIEPDAEGWSLATRLTDVRDFPRSGLDLDDDKSLVLAFQSGEIDAYSDIFVKYRALSAQICYRILQDREEADEAVQETMLRVYRGLATFNGRYQLQAWVARIATNVSLDMVRARARRPQREPDHTRHLREPRLVDRADGRSVRGGRKRPRPRGDPRDPVGDPDHHREALVLREFEGRSHEEIGEALGVSPQQAKALIHRAKKSFRRAWDRGGDRRGVAALAPSSSCRPSGCPGSSASCGSPRTTWWPTRPPPRSRPPSGDRGPAAAQGAMSWPTR